MMLRKLLIPAFLVMALLLFGCTAGPKASGSSGLGAASASASLAEQQMNLAGVQNAKIVGEGDVVTVSYNPSNVDYEGRIVAEWGAIFGVLEKDYPSASKYKILQLLDGQQVASLSVNASDVRDFSAGRISIIDFKRRMAYGGSKS